MITSYMYTNIGGRKVNEDSCITLEDGKEKCYVLCDGLGGHGKGEVASGMVTEVFDQCYHAGVSKPDQFIADTLMVAQSMLLSEQIAQKAQDEMKTTATAVLISEDTVYRAYIVEIENEKRSKETGERLKTVVYKVYAEDHTHVANIDEKGNVEYAEEFLKQLKDVNEEQLSLINTKGVKLQEEPNGKNEISYEEEKGKQEETNRKREEENRAFSEVSPVKWDR